LIKTRGQSSGAFWTWTNICSSASSMLHGVNNSRSIHPDSPLPFRLETPRIVDVTCTCINAFNQYFNDEGN
jgi:hypothetical protein